MAAASLESTVAFLAFGMFVGLDDGIGNLNKNRFQEGTGPRDAGRFHFTITLVIARAAASPGNQMLGRRKHRHIRTDLGENRNCGHGITGMCAYLVNVLQALYELGSLFAGYGPVNGGLDFIQGMLAALVDERRDIEFLAGVLQNIGDD